MIEFPTWKALGRELRSMWATSLDVVAEGNKTRALIIAITNRLEETMTEAFDRTEAALTNIQADEAGLIAAVTPLQASIATLTAEVATLTGGQDAAVAAAVAPVQAALDDVNAKLAQVASQAEAIAAAVPDAAPVTPPPAA